MSNSPTPALPTNAAFDSRNRMLSVRLSVGEYEKFRELCLTSGIRSLSELARVAINHFAKQPAHSVSQSSIEIRLSELEAKFRILSLELKGLHNKQQHHQSDTPPTTLD
jgi:hypothetical protein